ncbi:hypothetical protein NDU88_003887 [Pleurodeles waltl]|uniref:Uncharacterized protein n=1 Tax=Pleurodeles waltl TaxID=8319 RepID=A0AAV7RJU8_PLEWA|nr:hypothetical protein NDU88_003887 [Pleurodeles waltl]
MATPWRCDSLPRPRPGSQASLPSSKRHTRVGAPASRPQPAPTWKGAPAPKASGSRGPGPQRGPNINRAKKRASSAHSPPGAESSKMPGGNPPDGPGRRRHRSAA